MSIQNDTHLKFLAIGLNTTGLGHEEDSILEFCSWFFDLSKKEHNYSNTPIFKRIIYTERLNIDIFNLFINQPLIKTLAKRSILDTKQLQAFDKKNGILLNTNELILQLYNWLIYINYDPNIIKKIRNVGIKLTQTKQGAMIPKFNSEDDIYKLPKIKLNILCNNYLKYESIFLNRLEYWNLLFDVNVLDVKMLYLKNIDTMPLTIKECLVRSKINKNIDNNILNNTWILGELLSNKLSI